MKSWNKTILITGISLFLLIICNFELKAQHKKQLGAGASVGSDLGTVGVNLRGDFSLSPVWDISPDVMFYFKNQVNIFEINLNLQHHWSGNVFKPYALAGLNFSHRNFAKPIEVLSERDGNKLGVNIGGGVNLPVGPLEFYGETRFSIGGYENFALILGVLFPIGKNKESDIALPEDS